MSKTVGDAIDELVEETIDFYHELAKDSSPLIRQNARSIALHDLILGKHKYERAYEEVSAHIDECVQVEPRARKESD